MQVFHLRTIGGRLIEIGFADLLNGMMHEERAKGYLRAIQSSGRSLLDLINDILDLSKVEAGHLELESIDFDLAELIDKAVEMLKLGAAEGDTLKIGDVLASIDETAAKPEGAAKEEPKKEEKKYQV